MVGTPTDLARRLTDLGAAGLSQVMLLPPLAAKEDVLRDVAEHVMPLLGDSRALARHRAARVARGDGRPLATRTLTAALAPSSACSGSPPRRASVPKRYDVATVSTGWRTRGTSAFAPDGAMFFTERVGDVNVLPRWPGDDVQPLERRRAVEARAG